MNVHEKMLKNLIFFFQVILIVCHKCSYRINWLNIDRHFDFQQDIIGSTAFRKEYQRHWIFTIRYECWKSFQVSRQIFNVTMTLRGISKKNTHSKWMSSNKMNAALDERITLNGQLWIKLLCFLTSSRNRSTIIEFPLTK